MKPSVYLIQTPPFWLKTPPLSLTYLKSYLQSKSIAVGICDLNLLLFQATQLPLPRWLGLDADFEQNLFAFTRRQLPQVFDKLYKRIAPAQYIGFSLLKRNSAFSFSLAREIRRKFPDKKIIFGGPQTLWLDKNDQLQGPHHWIIGEGELPLKEILSGAQTTVYRFQEIADLDSLPLYDFSPLTPNHYSQSLPILSSRGCPHRCAFCSERLLYKRFRHHSPRYMLEQIQLLQKKYKTNSFVFLDSLINYSNAWLEQFCSLLIKNNLNVSWEAQMRIQKHFPLNLAKLMKQSGCYNLFVGLESASDAVLTAMNKGFTSNIALDFFKTLTEANLHFEVSLIFGHPAEKEKEFNETVHFIVRNKRIIPKIAQANPYIDYFNNQLSHDGQKIAAFLKILKRENIKYTKSFINNLMYG